MMFISDLRQVSGFLRFPPPIKLTASDSQQYHQYQQNTSTHLTLKQITTYDIVIPGQAQRRGRV